MVQPAEMPLALAPLRPLRVLELADDAPSAVAAMFLADLGAEVIKVEAPDGGPLRADGLHHAWDRGKRSVVADRADPANIQLIAALAAGADVVIAPEGIDAALLAPAALRAANPSLIHVTSSASGSLPGFGSGPARGPLVAARIGLMSQHVGVRAGPIYLGHPGIEHATAYVMIISTLAAIRAAGVTGQGQTVHVSMVDGVLALLTMSWQSARGGSTLQAGGRLDLGRRRLLLDSFECSDGKLIMVHTGAAGGFARALVLLGLDDEIPVDGGAVEMAAELTEREHERMQARLPGIFASRTREEWLRLFWEHQLAALPIEDLGVVFDDDQVRFNELVQIVEDPELGPIEVVASPMRIEGRPVRLRGGAPALGADGAAVRSTGWAGPPAPRPVVPRSLRHPLEDVRVVDLGAYFAGPFGSRLLADLGADVIKVEQVVGDPMRPLLDMFEAGSRGKRALSIDLKCPQAADVITALMRDADVLCHNLRPGAGERLGIDVDAARAVNPDVVYLHAPGFGSAGPKSMLQSFAPLHSGMVGMWSEAAGEGNRPARGFGNEDHYNGLLGACSMLVGLVHRDRTGRGLSIEAPQLHSSVFATSHVVRRDGVVIPTLPRLDGQQLGRGPFDRIYPCLEGWLAVVCRTEAEIAALLAELEIVADEHGNRDPSLADRIGARLRTRDARSWHAAMRSRQLPVEAVRESSWEPLVFDNPDLLAMGVVTDIDHPTWGPVRSIANLFHLGATPGRVTDRAPCLGEHTREVLAELGLPTATIDEWLDLGVARADGPPPVVVSTAGAPS